MFWKKKESSLQPEWLIVGLGNPGGEYKSTRHNVGFEVVERLADGHRIKLDKSRHRSRYGLGRLGKVAVCLVKPLTYMNLSGQSVAPLARGYGIKPDKVLVVADDLDLALGVLRLREGGSAGGHNGHKSIIQYLGTQDYPRIKIGIGKGSRSGTIDHVLSTFDPEERDRIDGAIRAAATAAERLLESGYPEAQRAVDDYNKGG